MLWLKLKAGALQLTLFIGVVIALILSAFILLVHTHKQFNIQTDFIIETTKATDEGIQYALANNIFLKDTTIIRVNDEDYKSLKINREFWGVFERVSSVSKIKNNRIKKSALIGGFSNKNDRIALYVQDNDMPLFLVGNTKIEGLAYLPDQRANAGTIAHQSYLGSQLIYGQIKRSNKLPELFSETISQIRSAQRLEFNLSENQNLNLEKGKVYKNSFFEPTKIVFSNSQIDLYDFNLIGNIIIQSKTKIVVDESSILKDVILIAPEIEIRDHVKGCFQAIASKNLSIGEDVVLNYPSALVLKEKEQLQDFIIEDNSFLCKLEVGSDSVVKGLVVYLAEPKSNNFDVQLELKENAIVVGEMYCNQNIELKGKVFGSVYANNFISKQFGSVYQNHIYNGTIIATNLPEEYIGLSFNNSKKGVVKWLY